jgi:O-antigen/teichoic acid export membrane protein/GT2 family glycosyltransferase
MTVVRPRPIPEATSPAVAPRLSLVVCTIGRPELLARFLDALEAGTVDRGLELIVVDQSADQACRAMLEARAPAIPWRCLRSEIGLSKGRNVGLAAATGDVVAFPDDDCWYAPDTLERVLAQFDADPEVDGVSIRAVTRDGRPACLRWLRRPTRVTATNYFRTSISFGIFCDRREVLRCGGFDETLGLGSSSWYGAGEESDLLLRLISRGQTIVYDPAIPVHHENPYDAAGPQLVDKMLRYGCGQGRLWALHRTSRFQVTYLLARKVGIAGVRFLTGKWTLSHADLAWVRGCVAGLRDQPPRGDVRSSPVSELRRSYLLRTATAGLGILATFGVTVVALRRLDDRHATVFLSVLAALMFGPLIGRLGLGTRSVQLLAGEARRPSDDVAAVHLWATAVGSLLVSPIVALFATAALAGRSERWPILGLTAVLVVLESVRLTVSDIMAALGRVGWSVLTTHSVRAIAVVGLVLAMLASGATITLSRLMLLQLAVAGLFLLLSLYRLAAWAPLGRPRSWRPLVDASRAGLVFLWVDVAFFVSGRADVWLSSWAFSPNLAERYSTASVFAYQVAVPVGLANIALMPTVARLWRLGDRDHLRRLIDAIATVGTVVTGLIVLVLWLAGRPIMAILFGSDLRPAGPLAAILATGIVAFTAVGASTVLLVITGYAARAAIAAFTALAALVPLAIAVAFLGGPRSLAVVSAAATVAFSMSQWVTARRSLGFAPTPSLDVAGAVRTLRGGSLRAPAEEPVGR